MSWQAYVDQQLVGTGKVSRGAIFGLDGSTWAISPGFNVSADEVKKIIAGFSDSGALLGSGIMCEGQKYMTLKADPRSVYGRKGNTGIVCVKTNQCFLVGFYDDKIQPGECTLVVEKLADYLIEQNY